MKIQSKFEIDQFIQRKTDRHGERDITIYQVMEIKSQTCYAGTQLFYEARPLHLTKEVQFGKEKEEKWVVSHGLDKHIGRPCMIMFREDEIILVSKDVLKIIEG